MKKVRLQLPAGADSLSIGREVFEADEDGCIEVFEDLAKFALDHGCTLDTRERAAPPASEASRPKMTLQQQGKK